MDFRWFHDILLETRCQLNFEDVDGMCLLFDAGNGVEAESLDYR